MGLVSRVVEAAGIPTVCISTGRDLTAQVKPPRSLFLNFPMGNSFGRSGDAATQAQVLRMALDLVVSATEPGVLIDAPLTWHEQVRFNLKPADREEQLKK